MWDSIGTEFGVRHELYERNYAGSYEAVRVDNIPMATASERIDELKAFVDRCLSEYALYHVWGYTIINDVAARDLQRRHQQWLHREVARHLLPDGLLDCYRRRDRSSATRHLLRGELSSPPAREHPGHDLRCRHIDRIDFEGDYAASRRDYSHRNSGRGGCRVQAATFSHAR
jgi:hypothetical protein